MFKKVRPARPQPFPAFVAHFGGVGLTRGAYFLYVSANAAKSGKSVSPKIRKKGDLPTRSRFNRHGTAGLSAVALAKAGGFFQHSHFLCHRCVIPPYQIVASESAATTIQEARPQRVAFPQNRWNRPRPFSATSPKQVAHRSSPQP